MLRDEYMEEKTIRLPAGIIFAEPWQASSLDVKWWSALVWRNRNPFARAMYFKWRKYFRDSGLVVAI